MPPLFKKNQNTFIKKFRAPSIFLFFVCLLQSSQPLEASIWDRLSFLSKKNPTAEEKTNENISKAMGKLLGIKKKLQKVIKSAPVVEENDGKGKISRLKFFGKRKVVELTEEDWQQVTSMTQKDLSPELDDADLLIYPEHKKDLSRIPPSQQKNRTKALLATQGSIKEVIDVYRASCEQAILHESKIEFLQTSLLKKHANRFQIDENKLRNFEQGTTYSALLKHINSLFDAGQSLVENLKTQSKALLHMIRKAKKVIKRKKQAAMQDGIKKKLPMKLDAAENHLERLLEILKTPYRLIKFKFAQVKSHIQQKKKEKEAQRRREAESLAKQLEGEKRESTRVSLIPTAPATGQSYTPSAPPP